MVPTLWYLCYGIYHMVPVLWSQHYSPFTMVPMLWPCTMDQILWSLYYGPCVMMGYHYVQDFGWKGGVHQVLSSIRNSMICHSVASWAKLWKSVVRGEAGCTIVASSQDCLHAKARESILCCHNPVHILASLAFILLIHCPGCSSLPLNSPWQKGPSDPHRFSVFPIGIFQLTVKAWVQNSQWMPQNAVHVKYPIFQGNS